MIEDLTSEQLLILDEIEKSPRFFIEQILGDTLDEQQIQIAEEFPYHRRMTVKSGHACGKDWLAARLGLWFHIVYYPSIVVTTGPTDRQVRQVVWGEIRQAYRKAQQRADQGLGLRIGGTLLPEAPHLRSPNPHHYMLGFTAGEDAAIQGFHAPNVLVIVTEAQGINPKLWLGLESLLTAQHSQLLLVGNAIYEPESEFYASFSSKSALYKTVTLDSEKSTYCTKDYIQDQLTVYGKESPVFLARVKGIFPTDISDCLIPLGWIERAHDLYDKLYGGDPIEPNLRGCSLGVDVARYGTAHTVFVLGRGDRFDVVHDVQGQDLMETCGYVARLIDQGLVSEEVRLDDTGLGGGITDRLKELKKPITPINFGAAAAAEDKYLNVRAEMYSLLRERFRTGTIAISRKDKTLTRDLAIIRQKMTSRGQIAIESKEEIKRRLTYSPDRADALALAALNSEIAKTVSSGAKSNRGILEYMRERAEKLRTDRTVAPLAKTPMAKVSPEAAQLLNQETLTRTKALLGGQNGPGTSAS